VPVRSKRPQAQRSGISQRDIESLREAICLGYPWLYHHADNMYRPSTLDFRLEILLAYVTGIGTLAVWTGHTTEDHPSKETVVAVKKLLKPDIRAAETKFKNVFTGERYSDDDFRYIRPG
jgi:hypothetical protein